MTRTNTASAMPYSGDSQIIRESWHVCKGEKLKLKDVVLPGIELGTSRTEGHALTSCATKDGL